MESMLHEITHIIHGRHDAAFYQLMDELREEYHMLLGNGQIQGAMPTTGGRKIGGSKWRGLSQREAAALAAERRRADARNGYLCDYDWPGTQEALRKSMQESALSNKRKREDLEDQQHLEEAIAASKSLELEEQRQIDELQLALAISASCACCGGSSSSFFLENQLCSSQ
jgi:hypothetical protein